MVARAYNSPEQYRFGFNGKEHEDELTGGDYEFGFRIYDSRIARFLSVDPLSKFYPWYTPYQFAGNNPIKFIDIDGLEEGTFKIDDQEKRLATLTWKKIYKVVQTGDKAVSTAYLDYLKSEKFNAGVSDEFNVGEGTTIYLRSPSFNEAGDLVSYKEATVKDYENEAEKTDAEKTVYKVTVKWDIKVSTEDVLDLEKAKAFVKENPKLHGYIAQGKTITPDKNGNVEVAHATVGFNPTVLDVITLNPIEMKNIDETRQYAYGKAVGHEMGHNFTLNHGSQYPTAGSMSNDFQENPDNVRITEEENLQVLKANKQAVKKQ